MVPGSNLTAIDYSSSVTKRIVHMTIALTMFMAMTLHQSVLLEALVVELGLTAKKHFSAALHACQKRTVHTNFALLPFVCFCLAFLLKHIRAKHLVYEEFDPGDSEQGAHDRVRVRKSIQGGDCVAARMRGALLFCAQHACQWKRRESPKSLYYCSSNIMTPRCKQCRVYLPRFCVRNSSSRSLSLLN